MAGAGRFLTVVDFRREREKDREVEIERERVEERKSGWVRERESRKEAELGTTSLESSRENIARLLLLGEEGCEGARILLSPFLTGPGPVKSFLIFF